VFVSLVIGFRFVSSSSIRFNFGGKSAPPYKFFVERLEKLKAFDDAETVTNLFTTKTAIEHICSSYHNARAVGYESKHIVAIVFVDEFVKLVNGLYYKYGFGRSSGLNKREIVTLILSNWCSNMSLRELEGSRSIPPIVSTLNASLPLLLSDAKTLGSNRPVKWIELKGMSRNETNKMHQALYKRLFEEFSLGSAELHRVWDALLHLCIVRTFCYGLCLCVCISLSLSLCVCVCLCVSLCAYFLLY